MIFVFYILIKIFFIFHFFLIGLLFLYSCVILFSYYPRNYITMLVLLKYNIIYIFTNSKPLQGTYNTLILYPTPAFFTTIVMDLNFTRHYFCFAQSHWYLSLYEPLFLLFIPSFIYVLPFRIISFCLNSSLKYFGVSLLSTNFILYLQNIFISSLLWRGFLLNIELSWQPKFFPPALWRCHFTDFLIPPFWLKRQLQSYSWSWKFSCTHHPSNIQEFFFVLGF